MARFLPLIFFITISGIILSCNITDSEETSEYEYEMSLTEQQLQKELKLVEDISDEAYCYGTCRTLIVPNNEEIRAKWSHVSLCRIDICHSTDLCTRGVDGLKERIGKCNSAYVTSSPVPVEPENDTESSAPAKINDSSESNEDISSSSEMVVDESSSGFSETGTEDSSSSSETIEESSSSLEIGY